MKDLDVNSSGGEVTVTNSHEIDNALVMYGYSVYLNHINEDTKDIIKGSSWGVTYEWALHNLSYDVGELFGIESLVESGKNLSVGATVYNDYDGSDWGKRKAMSVVMKIGYVIVGNPVDLLIYMWGK